MLNEFQGERDVAAILGAGTSLASAQKSPLNDGVPFVVVPEGYKVEHLFERDEYPARASGVVKLRDANSFVEYFNRQKRPESQIYASLDPAKILGLIDDHRAYNAANVDHDGANWRAYRVEFAVPASREWKVWTGKDRQPLDQLAFAELIEDNLPDIVSPDGSTMLSIALNFEASKEGNFVSATRLQDGSTNFVWKEDVNATGNKIAMPSQVTLNIPVFENGAPYSMEARIKYRVQNGTLKIWYELVRPHKVLESAFRAIWSQIEEQTESKILLGSPE
ncbi:phosphopentomutase [Burkholderia cepacia]|uniref:Phosphopentomutase n=1 Tax=Burkholderia cepacia TaxID=292 RepID=A0A2S8HSQ8_BURCE|nr:YfdQ family protein [Burkholderia cepacia]PQP05489.1 phosphopentomutase [Burkholderia cepacia]HDR9512280.1 YfdQ family protein [Burkholderia cepacia]